MIEINLYATGNYSQKVYDESRYLLERDYEKIKDKLGQTYCIPDLDGKYSETNGIITITERNDDYFKNKVVSLYDEDGEYLLNKINYLFNESDEELNRAIDYINKLPNKVRRLDTEIAKDDLDKLLNGEKVTGYILYGTERIKISIRR